MNSRDWEALSAYLDGHLTPRERSRLEARMKTEGEMQTAFEQLRRTRLLVRSLPRVQAPRNFTLTPQMVNAPKKVATPYPIFRLASALATVMLLMVMFGDYLTNRQIVPLPPSVARTVPETVAVVEEAALPTSAPAEPALGVQATSEGVIVQPVEKSLAFSETMTNTLEMAGDARTMAAQEVPATESLLMVAPEPQPTSTPESIAIQPSPMPEAVSELPQALPPETALDQSQTEVAPGINLFRLLEISLALLALSTALIAVILRRKASR